jgi:hypothetical protein
MTGWMITTGTVPNRLWWNWNEGIILHVANDATKESALSKRRHGSLTLILYDGLCREGSCAGIEAPPWGG